MPVQKEIFPLGWSAWSLERMRPVSGVSVVRTSQLLHDKHKENVKVALKHPVIHHQQLFRAAEISQLTEKNNNCFNLFGFFTKDFTLVCGKL